MKNPIVEAALRSGLVLDAKSDFAHKLGALAATDPARAQRLASSSATNAERVGMVMAAKGVDAANAIEFARVFGAPDPVNNLAAATGIGTLSNARAADDALLVAESHARGLDADKVSAMARAFGFRGELGASLAGERARGSR